MLRNGTIFWVAAVLAGATLTGGVQATENEGWVPSSLFQFAR